MIARAKKNGARTLIERAIANENIGICTVCNKKIKNDDLIARKIDGVWLCGYSCIEKFLEEKKMWTPNDWGELCKLQILYEERKRAEIKSIPMREFCKISCCPPPS